MSTYVYVCLSACVCVCVSEREKEVIFMRYLCGGLVAEIEPICGDPDRQNNLYYVICYTKLFELLIESREVTLRFGDLCDDPWSTMKCFDSLFPSLLSLSRLPNGSEREVLLLSK
ncbi:hypothetical protein T492DRAFT_419300 [Pavlovales sp. CCMP2436]|nr:hypothetical protein T492DRAFT_419300 [Pavlovales sp. CCMP2436]